MSQIFVCVQYSLSSSRIKYDGDSFSMRLHTSKHAQTQNTDMITI